MPPVSADGALVGRDGELALLTELVTALSAGRGRAVLIEGEPGIGKTALMRAALAGAPQDNCKVFWGTGDELGQALPLVPFLDGLGVREPSANPRRNTIVRLLRGEIAADRGTDVLAEQLLALVTEQCSVRPTILVVDDLQWADPASITLWRRLARSTRQMPLLLAGMMRPVPLRDDLLALRRAEGLAARLQLTALPADATAKLVEILAGGKPDTALLRLADGAAGNPLYVAELVAALARSFSLTVTGTGSVALASDRAPESLSAAIADRLGFVTRTTHDVLRAAALLGMDFAVPDLALVLHGSATDLIAAVDEACAAGVLAESATGLSFRHPLIRSALYDEMPAPVRAAWHRDVGRALAAAGAPPDRVARQMLRAVIDDGDTTGPADGTPMDGWMLDWLTRSADALVVQAPEVAAELLTRAAASGRSDLAQHGWLASRLADALYRIGDRVAAEDVVKEALELDCEPDLLVDLHWTLAQCRMRSGSSTESLATLNRALATRGLSARHHARLLVLIARTCDHLGQLDQAAEAATRAIDAATEGDDKGAMGWALHVLALVTAVRGDLAGSLPLYDQALAVAEADPALTDLRMLLQTNKALTLGYLSRYEQAFAAARQAQQLARQVGTTLRLAQAHGALGQLLFETGRWDDALAELAAVPEDLKEPAGACCELSVSALIFFHRGEAEVARRYLTAAAPHAARVGRLLIGSYVLARSLEREVDGALPAALDALTAGCGDSTEEHQDIEDLLADAVRLATVTGDQATAQAFAARAAALASRSQIPHRRANALYCRGLLDHDAPRLLAAAEAYQEASRPLLKGKALETAAQEFVAIGDRSQARAAFTQAVEVYMSLGAGADAARLQTAFRAHGFRRGPRGNRPPARKGWDSLTPTEMKVAALVEDGLSNPEIAGRLLLSRKTVANHVSHILKKLDVHSRPDIARESALRTVSSR